ncbi:MAG: hypothetical protein PHC43_05355, partial [Candidatus Marinimicrobia bacterium]|nr:hypothetical protein [Candidatus Neomarinimicrobiota bacterium]
MLSRACDFQSVDRRFDRLAGDLWLLQFYRRVRREILIAKFGQEYRDYQRRTGRWLPKIFLKT